MACPSLRLRDEESATGRAQERDAYARSPWARTQTARPRSYLLLFNSDCAKFIYTFPSGLDPAASGAPIVMLSISFIPGKKLGLSRVQ